MLSKMTSYLYKGESYHALDFYHGGMMLFEMSSFLFKGES
jgi:hypothetical protein